MRREVSLLDRSLSFEFVSGKSMTIESFGAFCRVFGKAYFVKIGVFILAYCVFIWGASLLAIVFSYPLFMVLAAALTLHHEIKHGIVDRDTWRVIK